MFLNHSFLPFDRACWETSIRWLLRSSNVSVSFYFSGHSHKTATMEISCSLGAHRLSHCVVPFIASISPITEKHTKDKRIQLAWLRRSEANLIPHFTLEYFSLIKTHFCFCTEGNNGRYTSHSIWRWRESSRISSMFTSTCEYAFTSRWGSSFLFHSFHSFMMLLF